MQWTPVLKTHPVIAVSDHFGVCKAACIAQRAWTCKRRERRVRYSLRSELGCKGKNATQGRGGRVKHGTEGGSTKRACKEVIRAP